MKYIMLETKDGQKLPILFPEALTHLLVAAAIQQAFPPSGRGMINANVVSAGFVALGTDVETYGESESLGGLKSDPSDAARIIVGDSVAFMPDALALAMLHKIRTIKKD